jgi:hypothetical protein
VRSRNSHTSGIHALHVSRTPHFNVEPEQTNLAQRKTSGKGPRAIALRLQTFW